MLTIMFCGVNRGNRNHLWNISVRGAPSCMIDRLYAKVDMGATNDRFLLVPDFLNDSLGSEFTAFLHHVEGVSEKLKQLFLENRYDVDFWKLPACANNGVLHGLQVKARQKILSDGLYALVGKPVQAVIKLSCEHLFNTGTVWFVI